MALVYQLPTPAQRKLQADAEAEGYDVYFDEVSGSLTVKGERVAVEVTGEGYGLDMLVDCTRRPELSLGQVRAMLGL